MGTDTERKTSYIKIGRTGNISADNPSGKGKVKKRFVGTIQSVKDAVEEAIPLFVSEKRNQRSLMARKGRRLNGTMKIND